MTSHTLQCGGQERLELYLYTPFGLYSASVAVQKGTMSFLVVKSGQGG